MLESYYVCSFVTSSYTRHYLNRRRSTRPAALPPRSLTLFTISSSSSHVLRLILESYQNTCHVHLLGLSNLGAELGLHLSTSAVLTFIRWKMCPRYGKIKILISSVTLGICKQSASPRNVKLTTHKPLFNMMTFDLTRASIRTQFEDVDEK